MANATPEEPKQEPNATPEDQAVQPAGNSAGDSELQAPESNWWELTEPDPGFTDRGVPTFDAVRERIEGMTNQAVGDEILDAESDRGRTEANEREQLEQAGKDRLEQLRKQMGQ